MCCWILFAKILLRIFASMYISDIGQKFSFFVLSLVLVSGWSWPHRISLEVLLPLQFFERVLIGQPLYCSTADAGMRGERGYGDGFTPYAWLSSITLLPWLLPWLSSTGISHQNLLTHIPWTHLPTVNSSPCPQITPQSLSSQLPATVPSRGPASLSQVFMAAARTLWFSFHLGCHRSTVPLSALNVSPLTQTVAQCGDQTPTSVPPPTEGRSSPINTPVFPLVPSSYQVLCGSVCSFLLFRYSCPHSAGVLHALKHLMVYSWCIHRERCTQRPPIPLPSCSSCPLAFLLAAFTFL